MAYTIQDVKAIHNINLGNQFETGVTEIEFDVSAWATLYPTGAASVSTDPGVSVGLWITYIRPTETIVYIVDHDDLSLADDILTWTVKGAITDISGQGTLVVHCSESDIEVRSLITRIDVMAGHGDASGLLTDPRVLTTAGDLMTFTTIPARLAIGTNGYILGSNGTSPVWIAQTAHNVSRYVAAPVTGSSSGVVGDWSADANYAYFCYATNTWVRCIKTAW